MKVYLVIGLVIAALSGALWYSIERNLDTSAQLASVSGALDRQKQENTQTRNQMRELERERDRLATRIQRIRSRETELEAALETERAHRAHLEEKNEAFRRWSRTNLPDAVVRLLRESSLYPDDGISGVRQRETPGDDGEAPVEGSGSKERRPSGAD